MSAPDTNVDKQAKRHRPSIVGIAVALIFAFIVAVVIITLIPEDADDPQVNPNTESEATTEAPVE